MPPLLNAAQKIAPEVVADRRLIHQFPELMYEVHKTAGMVEQRLRELGLEVRTKVGRTGVVGVLRGGRPGMTVLLRADMDALPIVEDNEHGFCSQNRGIMHACGHDAHTAILLGTAKVLSGQREQIQGNVVFMFQPAEEGGAGALRMIEDGLMDNPKVDGAFALHVDANNYVGKVSMRVGPQSAAADEFSVTVRGRGGHASRPQAAVDPVVIGAHIVTALQTLVSREVSPMEPAVVTVGRLVGGSAFNVIPATAIIEGTVRTYNEGVQAHIERRLPVMVKGIAEAMRATAEVEYRRLYPLLVNHATGVEVAWSVVTELLGPKAALEGEAIMGSEDFSFVLQKAPGAMVRLGVRNKDWKQIRPTHSPEFDMDETALPLGVAVMAGMAVKFLDG